MQPEHTKKKLAEMTSEERRAYNAASKRKSRDKEKKLRLAAMVPAYAEYQVPDTQRDQLAEHSRHMIETISAELRPLSFEDERMIEMMTDVLLGYEKDWMKQVHSPTGCVCGRYLPDAAGGEVIEHVHRFPKLLESHTFADQYQKFLKVVRKLSRNSWFDPEFAKDIEAELSGTYNLRPKPDIPKLPEPAPPEPPVLNFAEVSERSRARLLDRLKENLSPDMQQYLDGN